MGYITRCDFDIFISYARNDNDLKFGDKGWVEKLVYMLRIAVKQRLGNADNLRIFFDTSTLAGNDQLSSILKAARSSATFLVIASPSYVERSWTRQELDAFVENTNDTRRLFALECLQLSSEQKYPKPLDEQNRISFWVPIDSSAPEVGVMPLEPASSLFKIRINTLAEQISRKLKSLNGEGIETIVTNQQRAPEQTTLSQNSSEPVRTETAQQGVVNQPAPNEDIKTVLLGQVPAEMQIECDEFTSYLEQHGISVLTEHMHLQDGLAFQDSFLKAASQADIYVQMLGVGKGPLFPDLNISYSRMQAGLASTLGLKSYYWRRPDIKEEQIVEAQHREMVFGPKVMSIGLETFKSYILKELANYPEKNVAREAVSDKEFKVFVNSDINDRAAARQIENFIKNHKRLEPLLPATSGTAGKVRSLLENHYCKSDLVVFLCGNASPGWLMGHARFFNKVRSRRDAPPKGIAVVYGPRFQNGATDVKLPEAIKLFSENEWNYKSVEDFILSNI